MAIKLVQMTAKNKKRRALRYARCFLYVNCCCHLVNCCRHLAGAVL